MWHGVFCLCVSCAVGIGDICETLGFESLIFVGCEENSETIRDDMLLTNETMGLLKRFRFLGQNRKENPNPVFRRPLSFYHSNAHKCSKSYLIMPPPIKD